MRKRFIILIDNTTNEQDEKFLEYIKENGFGWWHYLNNSWLLTSYKDFTVNKIRDDLNKIYEGETKLIIELRGNTNDTWAGFGPQGETRNMFTWLKETWNKKD